MQKWFLLQKPFYSTQSNLRKLSFPFLFALGNKIIAATLAKTGIPPTLSTAPSRLPPHVTSTLVLVHCLCSCPIFPSLCPLCPRRWAAWSPAVPYVADLLYSGLRSLGKTVIDCSSDTGKVITISARYLRRDLINSKTFWFYTRLRAHPTEAEGFLWVLG